MGTRGYFPAGKATEA